MNAKFYNNKSDERYVNKNLELKHDNISITFKENTDLVRPTFILQSGLLTPSVNYLYVTELGRYYFIKDIQFTQGMSEILCEVDVLTTYKTALLKQNVIVKRQEKKYNLYQVDEKMCLYNPPAERILEFPSGFNYGTQEFILLLTGASTGGGS